MGAHKTRMPIRPQSLKTGLKRVQERRAVVEFGVEAICVMLLVRSWFFFSHVQRLSEDYFRSNELLILVQEMSRQHSNHEVAWTLLVIFSQIYCDNLRRKQRRNIWKNWIRKPCVKLGLGSFFQYAQPPRCSETVQPGTLKPLLMLKMVANLGLNHMVLVLQICRMLELGINDASTKILKEGLEGQTKCSRVQSHCGHPLERSKFKDKEEAKVAVENQEIKKCQECETLF